jgi:Xaa-Pro aminopeptidase
MLATPAEEIRRRIRLLQSYMRGAELDAALIVQQADLFYLSGTGQDAHLYVPAEGSPALIVRKDFARASDDSPIEVIVEISRLSELPGLIETQSGPVPKRIGLELDVMPVNTFRVYERIFPDTLFHDVSPLIRQARMVKSPYELDLMRASAGLNQEAFAYIKEILREGMSELEFSGLLEAKMRKDGHQGLVRVRAFNQEVFYGHIMSGENLAVPSCSVGPTGGPGTNPSYPQGGGHKIIRRHEPVQIDYVGVHNGYIVDQARTFYIGKPPEKFMRAHQVALQIQDTVAEQAVPGKRAEELYDLALQMAADAGLAEGFLGWPHPVRFVGHGCGIELDELPVLGRRSPHVLEAGMTIAVEPKFIFPGEGLAGIENTFVVNSDGAEKLTTFDDAVQILE